MCFHKYINRNAFTVRNSNANVIISTIVFVNYLNRLTFHSVTLLDTQGVPNVGEFIMASSISDLNSSYDTSDFILCNGRKSTLPHVLLRGRTSFQNLIVGLGSKPRGGISFAHVANIRTSLSFTSPSSGSKNCMYTYVVILRRRAKRTCAKTMLKSYQPSKRIYKVCFVIQTYIKMFYLGDLEGSLSNALQL